MVVTGTEQRVYGTLIKGCLLFNTYDEITPPIIMVSYYDNGWHRISTTTDTYEVIVNPQPYYISISCNEIYDIDTVKMRKYCGSNYTGFICLSNPQISYNIIDGSSYSITNDAAYTIHRGSTIVNNQTFTNYDLYPHKVTFNPYVDICNDIRHIRIRVNRWIWIGFHKNQYIKVTYSRSCNPTVKYSNGKNSIDIKELTNTSIIKVALNY